MKEIALFETPTEGSEIIRKLLLHLGYSVLSINGKDIRNMSLSPRKYDLIVFPGGSPHIYNAFFSKRFRNNVREYVKGGGSCLGICGGASLAGLLHLGGVSTNWLNLFPWHARYLRTGGKGVAEMSWQPGNIFRAHDSTRITWAAGPYFTDSGQLKVEALYGESPVVAANGKPAILSGKVGAGKIVLFGPHPEYPCPYPYGKSNAHLIVRAVEWLLQ